MAELHEGGERVGQHGARRAGPDRRSHGQQVPVAEGLRIVLEVEVLAERQGRHGTLVRHARGLAVEAQDVAQHGKEGRADQVATLGEYAGEVGAGPFELGLGEADAEAHLGLDRLDLQQGEQRAQVGIGAAVEDQEAGVDRMGEAVDRDVDGVGVATDVAARLEQRHAVLRREQPRGREAGDAAADHRDAPPLAAPARLACGVQALDLTHLHGTYSGAFSPSMRA